MPIAKSSLLAALFLVFAATSQSVAGHRILLRDDAGTKENSTPPAKLDSASQSVRIQSH